MRRSDAPASARSLIVVVDDNDAIRDWLDRILRAAGFDVVSFDSAEAFIADEPLILDPDCMIVDVELPGMSGLDLIDELRRLDVAVPAIVMTARVDSELCVRAARQGCEGFFLKPFASNDLLMKVRETCARSAG